MYPIDYDEPQFLEPAHSHDPVQVSYLLPTSLNENIPGSFRDALTVLQESNSVAFASSKRLHALVGDRFNRLVPAKVELSSIPVNEGGNIRCRASLSRCLYLNSAETYLSDSEPAFFTYQNQLRAEKRYLLEEALPDWRHKAARVFQEHRHSDNKAVFSGRTVPQTDFETWWSKLQEEIHKLLEDAEDTEVPEFEDTVAEYRIYRTKEIKKGEAREERRSRKIMLELDAPELKIRERAETMDSGIDMAFIPEAGE
jgi:hypothetical protein